MMSAWTKFRSALRAFRVAHAGNVAITFALATLPIIAIVGFAVDYSRANAVKAAMQAALDSTALMISKEAATDTNTQLQTNAQKYFLALFARPDATNVTVTANFTTDGGTSVVVNGATDVPTSILSAIGYGVITVSGSSTAKWGSNLLRVALVLDNTGSMADLGKMSALQSATKSLLTQLQTAATNNGDVYVSIVPFVKDVNVGASNYTSDYLYWDDAAKSDNNSWDANNGTCSVSGYSPRNTCIAKSSCSISGYTTQSTCTGAGTCSVSGNNSQSSCSTAGTCTISGKSSQSTCTGAGICSNGAETTQSTCTGNKACSKSQYASKNNCQNNGGTWGFGTWSHGVWTAATWTPGVWTAATWTPNNHSTWTGCVRDRGNSGGPDTVANYDSNVGSTDITIPSSLYPAEQYSSCPQAVMGLNYNWTSMKSLVDNMSPSGSTNQAIGLQLGWMSLVGGGPFSVPAYKTGYTYSKAIILLTDGLNTQDRWYGDGSSLGTSDDAKIDAREALTCANFKAASTTNVIYTIQVNTGNDPTSTLLQNCASTSDKFYLLTSASQIITAFTKIGTDLSQLRVAK
jgi:Flp pilus assembly protein TadG